MIPLFKVHMPESVMDPLKAVLMSGYIGQGTKVDEFEKALVPWIGHPNILSLNSGTSALYLALKLAGVGYEDEVISTPMTCMASNTPIMDHKAKIVWADIDPWTGNIDPVDVERKITARTKAVMAVHWGGYPCEIDELLRVTKKYGIPLIEDAAHAFGAVYRGRKIGALSQFTCFSFQAIKHLTTVDGGALVASTNEGYRRGKLLRWYGIDRETPKRDLRCLHGYSRVKLANGKSMSIREIVRKKHPGPVLCLNKQGLATPTKVIGWFESDRAKRPVFDVSLSSDRGLRRAQLTYDHKVLTKRGYVTVSDIRTSDLVASSFPSPSALQRKVIVGSLMGDATMATRGKNRVFKRNLYENHTRIEGEYIKLKASSLGGLGAQIYSIPANKRSKRPNESVGYWVPCIPSLQEFGDAFYKNGEKRVPRELLTREWDPLVLACWFMDDGSTDVHNGRERVFPYCQLATNGFSRHDVFWLSRFMSAKGYSCSAKTHKGSPGYRLFFTREASDKIIKDIAPYVPPSMRVMVAHSGEPFDVSLWGDGHSDVFYDTVRIEKSKWGGKKVYCIRVENDSHNFFAPPLVVANCEDDVVETGGKMHMNDVCATIGLENLKHVGKTLETHRSNAAFYDERLEGLRRVKKLRYEKDRLSAYWLYTIRVDDQESFYDHMSKSGVMVSKVHVRNDVHTCFRAFRKNLPGVDEFSSKEMCIPVGWWVTKEDRETIAKAVVKWDEGR